MNQLEILLISFSVAADAFTVSLAKGLSKKELQKKDAIKIACYFSLFQILMPLIGYKLGTNYAFYIIKFAHIIVSFILAIIGLKMLTDCNKEENVNDRLDFKEMLILSISTSIDALAIGLSFSLIRVNLINAILSIGFITFITCYFGAIMGNKIGNKYKDKAQFIGAIILIILAIKIFLYK